MDNDYEYEAGDTDFGDTDSGATDNHESTLSETDQVAALLMGEDIEDDEEHPEQRSRDNAKTKIYDHDGTRKSNHREFTTVPIDNWGNPQYGGSEQLSQPKQEKPEEYGFIGHDISENLKAAQAQWDQALEANQRVETAFQNGEITESEYQQATFMAGQLAGQARTNAYENTIARYEHERQQQHAFNQLEKEFPEDFGPERRQDTFREAAKFLRDQGISDDLLREVEDPAIISAIHRSRLAIEKQQSDRIEIAGLKAKVRELNKALGRGKKKAERGSQLGIRNRGPVGEAQMDEIMRLIGGGE